MPTSFHLQPLLERPRREPAGETGQGRTLPVRGEGAGSSSPAGAGGRDEGSRAGSSDWDPRRSRLAPHLRGHDARGPLRATRQSETLGGGGAADRGGAGEAQGQDVRPSRPKPGRPVSSAALNGRVARARRCGHSNWVAGSSATATAAAALGAGRDGAGGVVVGPRARGCARSRRSGQP